MNRKAHNLARATLVAACITPSLAANIWPRLSQMLDQGVADAGTVAIVITLAVSVMLMASVPFAMERAANWGSKALFLFIGLGLAGLNFGNAVEVASQVRDSLRDPKQASIASRARLDADLTVAIESRSRVPQFERTVAAAVDAATRAVDEAIVARDQECGRVGRNCRKRVAELTARNEELAQLHKQKALTDQADKLDAEIARIRQETKDLGVVPTHADPGAARLAKVLGVFFDLGDRPADVVSEWWPIWIGVVIEIIAMWGPKMLITAMLPPIPAPTQTVARPTHSLFRRDPVPGKPAAQPAIPVKEPVTPGRAARETATVTPTVATATKPKKPKKSVLGPARPYGDVREFRESRTVARLGTRIRCKEVFNAYEEWCQDEGKTPVSLTKFGTEIKSSGVGFDNKNNRAAYLDIGLVGAPRLAVSN